MVSILISATAAGESMNEMFSESSPNTDGLSGVGVDVDVEVDNLALHDSRFLALFPVAQVVEMTDDVRRVMKTFRRTDVVTSIVDFRMICIVVVSVGVVFDATMMSFGFGLAFNTRTIRTLMMTNRPKGMMCPKTVLAPTK